MRWSDEDLFFSTHNNQWLDWRHLAREAAEKLLRGGTGGTVLCSHLLCLEKIFSTFGFDYRPLLLCWFVKQSNFVLHFLSVFSLGLLQTLLLKVLFNYCQNKSTSICSHNTTTFAAGCREIKSHNTLQHDTKEIQLKILKTFLKSRRERNRKVEAEIENKRALKSILLKAENIKANGDIKDVMKEKKYV